MELGRQVRVAGGGGRQLVEHVVVTLRLGLVSDPRLLQEIILAEININKTYLILGFWLRQGAQGVTLSVCPSVRDKVL